LAKRIKKRYLAIASEPRQPPSKMMKALITSYEELFGKLGLASAGLKLIRGYQDEGLIIVRCTLESLPKTLLAAASIRELEGRETVFRVLAVSGTIRSLMGKISSMSYA